MALIYPSNVVLVAVTVLCMIMCCHSLVDECLRDNNTICHQCEDPGKSLGSECTACIDNRLDPKFNCTQCQDEVMDCSTGNFTLSVTFHSYLNEQHLCGECQATGPVCCDTVNQTKGCNTTCGIRLFVSVEPYEAPVRDVIVPRHRLDFDSDNISIFFEGEDVFNRSNISNPYQVQMDAWTGHFQFYAVVFDSYRVPGGARSLGRFAIDRFAINVSFGSLMVPAGIPRMTYTGIYGISQFVLSFHIGCSEGFTGPSCNIPCGDSCPTVPPPTLDDETDGSRSTASSSANSALVGGVVGGVIAIVMVSLLCFILAFLLCQQRRRKHKADLVAMQYDGSEDVARVKDLDNPIYKFEEDDKEASQEHVYSQPNGSKVNGKPAALNKVGNEREFQNSIYGHDLVSTTYTDTVAQKSSSSSPVNTSKKHVQDMSSALNGGVEYAVLGNREPDQYDDIHEANEQQMASVQSRQCNLQLRPPIGHYEMADGSSADQYDVAHPPSGENYEVAHPPRDEHYDVTRSTNNQATLPSSDQYDVAHPPNDQYDVAHPPNDHYDVAHPPNDQYDVAHQPHPPVHIPSDHYDVAHLPADDQYDVAHPPPTSGVVKPSGDHHAALSNPYGEIYDDIVGQQGSEHYDDVVRPQGNGPYDDVLLPPDDQYDVAHLPPSNNYEGQNAHYDVPHEPNGWNKETKNNRLQSNPRYESADMNTNFYSVLESTDH